MGRSLLDTLRNRHSGTKPLITLVKNSAALSTEWVASAEDIPDALWNCCFPEHLEGKWWYVALERSKLESQFAFKYAVVRAGEKAIAIAPVFLMDLPMELVAPPLLASILNFGGRFFPSIRYQRTLFVGSVCADEGTIGIVPGIKQEPVLKEIQIAVEKLAADVNAAMITWKDFPDAVRDTLERISPQFDMWSLTSFPGTTVRFESASIEAYYKSLKGSRRHNLKKKLKKSKKAVDLITNVITQPDAETLDEIFALFWQTYEHGKTKFEVLTREFFTEIAKKKDSHFVVLRKKDGGEMVAFMLCFKLRGKVINKFIGLDYTLPNEWFLYFRLWEAALEWVLCHGVSEFQSGQTGYRAKIDVGNELIPLTNFCKHRNPLLNHVYRWMSKDVNWSSLDQDLKTFLTAHPELDDSGTVFGGSAVVPIGSTS